MEDDNAQRNALVRLFRGSEVTACKTAAEARALLLTQAFDVVVSDVHLPDGDGIQLFDEVVRARPSQAGRYLFLSGAADAPDVGARLDRTGAPYLKKPFVVRTLLDLVSALGGPPPSASEEMPGV